MNFRFSYFGLIFVIYGIIFDVVSANWLPTGTTCTSLNSTTINSGTILVPKVEGVSQYCAKQELLENPYSGSTITFNGASYTITFPDSTVVTQTAVPDQTPKFLGNYIIKTKIYKYDKTPPNTCTAGIAPVYFGTLPASSTGAYVAYTGGWTNQELFSRARCTDRVPAVGVIVSGCDKTFYDTIATHGSNKVLLTFSDNAGNQTLSHWCSYGYTVLKDAHAPQISVENPDGEYLSAIGDPSYTSGAMLATNSTYFTVRISDAPDGSSAASGIRSYSGLIYQTHDYLRNPVPFAVSCSLPSTDIVPPVDPTDAYSVTHALAPITFNCNVGPSFRRTGIYKLKIFATDDAGNLSTFETNIIVFPNNEIHLNELSTVHPPVRSNGVDTHDVVILVSDQYDNPIPNLTVDNISYNNTGIYLDEVNRVGGPALFITSPSPSTTSSTGIITLQMSSIAPGTISSNLFSFSIINWTDPATYLVPTGTSSVYSTSIPNTAIFLRPYTASFTMSPTFINLGYTHTGMLNVILSDFSPSSYVVNNFSSTISAIDPNLSISEKIAFSTTGSTFVPEQIGPNIIDFKTYTHPYAEYTMSGTIVRSYITPQPTSTGGEVIISNSSGSINRIFIIGNKQTSGKEGFVSNVGNLGSPTTVNMRNAIKKNALISVRSRVPNIASDPAPAIISGIKYIKGDYTITNTEASTRDWESLIVIDGNITIASDVFNTEGKSILLAAIRSDYNENHGNIYIKPNVKFISSLIYSDGVMKSVDASGNVFATLNSTRMSALNNQLVLKGVYITYNTIGGAVLGGANSGVGGMRYTLPGNKGTNNLNEAVNYDLSFLRSGNTGFDMITGTKLYNLGNNAYTVVIYDTKYLQSPPPGFSTQL